MACHRFTTIVLDHVIQDSAARFYIQILINIILTLSPGSWASLCLHRWRKVAKGQLHTPISDLTLAGVVLQVW